MQVCVSKNTNQCSPVIQFLYIRLFSICMKRFYV